MKRKINENNFSFFQIFPTDPIPSLTIFPHNFEGIIL